MEVFTKNMKKACQVTHIYGIENALHLYTSIEEDVPTTQINSISECVVNIESTLVNAKSVLAKMSSLNGFGLWQVYKTLMQKYQAIIYTCEKMNLPPKKRIVAEFTDVGQGVRVSNFEVKFRMAELTRS